MSPRKPTIDGLDDVDDQDGTLEEEARQKSDLKLQRRDADDVELGGAPADDDADETGSEEDRKTRR